MKSKFLISFIVIIFLGSLFPVNATSVGSDPSDDVSSVNWNNDGFTWSYSVTSAKPEVDITGVEYDVTTSGNISISILLKGSPLTDDETFYSITIEDTVSGLTLLVWYGGGYGSATSADNSGFTYTKGTTTGFGVTEVTVGDNSIVHVFPEIIKSALNEDITLDLPTTPSTSWSWTVWAWNGQDIGTNSGTWYMDYYPDEANFYATGEPNNNNSNSNQTNASGFELITLFGSLGVSTFVLTQGKRK